MKDKPILSENDWMKRFDNHEEMFRQQGKQICDLADYVFKMENRQKEMFKIIKELNASVKEALIRLDKQEEIIEKLAERAVLKEEIK